MRKINSSIIKTAAINAALTAIYVAAIASFLFYAPKMLGYSDRDTVLVPIVMLLLFVFSAALTGSLIFGLPALWYLEGRKKDAFYLLVCTLLIFLIITLAVFLALYLTKYLAG